MTAERVLASGHWPPLRGGAPREYVVLYEPTRHRVVIWERASAEDALHRAEAIHALRAAGVLLRAPTERAGWTRWGTYELAEFSGDLRRLMQVVRSDLRYEGLPLDVRAAERGPERAQAKAAWRRTMNDPAGRRRARARRDPARILSFEDARQRRDRARARVRAEALVLEAEEASNRAVDAMEKVMDVFERTGTARLPASSLHVERATLLVKRATVLWLDASYEFENAGLRAEARRAYDEVERWRAIMRAVLPPRSARDPDSSQNPRTHVRRIPTSRRGGMKDEVHERARRAGIAANLLRDREGTFRTSHEMAHLSDAAAEAYREAAVVLEREGEAKEARVLREKARRFEMNAAHFRSRA